MVMARHDLENIESEIENFTLYPFSGLRVEYLIYCLHFNILTFFNTRTCIFIFLEFIDLS